MAIIMMTSKEPNGDNIYALSQVSLDYYGWKGEKPIVMERTFDGCVLQLRERNGYDDSDFEALVWDDAQGCARWIMYATTRGWSYPNNAVVDATDEVLAKYNAWNDAIRSAREAKAKRLDDADATKGKEVVVVKGKKYLGKTGTVIWRGANKFGTYYKNGYNKPSDYYNQRVGVKTETGETFFIPLEYVRVVGFEDVDPCEIDAWKCVYG